MPTVAITGASGLIGIQLTDHFLDMGWGVVALVRDPGSMKEHKMLRALPYDLTKPVDPTLFKGVDYLVHAAYLAKKDTKLNVKEVNIEAAKNIIQASANRRLVRRVFISSMSSHDEAISAYGIQKFAIEKLFVHKNDSIVRPGLVIGNGGIVKNMVSFMRSKHLVPLVAGGRQPLQIIDVRDLAIAIEKILIINKSDTYSIATQEIYTYKEFYKRLSKILSIKVFYINLPYPILYCALAALSILNLPINISTDNLRGLKMLRPADTKDDLAKIGLVPRSLEESLRTTNGL